jgi:HK97 family phage prohead protease
MLQYGLPVPIGETKARKDHWEVSGYLSTYGNTDYGGDVVEAGAFDRWLNGPNKTRFLYSHRPDKVLGVYQELKSDKQGLFARAKISQTDLGKEVYTLVQDGAVDSFSIGYMTVKSDNKEGTRYLKELDLPEGSLVAIPMNPQAAVTAWKDWVSAFELEEPTMAEKAEMLTKALDELMNDTRGLVDSIDKPLSVTKREELKKLLTLCEGMDDVRTSLKTVLTVPPGIVEARRLRYEISQRRTRLARVLGE